MAKADHLERITDQQLDELRKKHTRIKHVVYNGNDLVFRRPKRAECQQHAVKNQSGDVGERVSADEQLAQLLIVQVNDINAPGKVKQAFTDLLEDWPFLCSCKPVAMALSMLTGVVQDDELKSFGDISTGSDSPLTTTPAG